MNKKYSFKSFTNQTFTGVDPAEFNNSEIARSCFYQEGAPDKHVFPDNIQGVTFRECNLDNVYLPPGNIIIGGSHDKIMVQNDLEDWIVDDSLKPIQPVNDSAFDELGISKDPKDIPTKKKEQPITIEKFDLGVSL